MIDHKESHCVIRLPDGLEARDLEIIKCPNPRKNKLNERKFVRYGKVIEGALISVRWNLRRVLFSEEDPACLDCMRCVCDCKCDSCEFVDICNIWDH